MTSASPATIYDIAKHAGVGIATVSRVLNGSARVAAPTRMAVRRAVTELGWRPSRAARRLAAGGIERPRLIALMPLFSANFYHAVTSPLALGLSAAGIDLAIHDVEDRATKNRLLDRILAERACDLLMLCSMRIGPERVAQLAALAIPTVFVDHAMDGFPSVWVDNQAGAAMAVELLRQRGASRIGYIAGPIASHAFRARLAGFRACAGAEAPVETAAAMSVSEGRAAFSRLLQREPRLDGIACTSDLPAIGAILEARQRRLRVPHDLQVIGFDDQPLMDVFGLSTVHQPLAAFGSWALQAIRRLTADPTAAVTSVQLPLTLVERTTTRSPSVQRSRAASSHHTSSKS